MYVCLCRGLKEEDLRCAARSGCASPEALIARLELDADDCCGRCARDIDALVELAAAFTDRFEPREPATIASFV
jgi:bacterioferritin-associated ferredoxin